MITKVYQTFNDAQVTDEMLQRAAELFSNNYGVWGLEATERVGAFAKPGTPVRLVMINDKLAGNAFACRWKTSGYNVCWITQLVVHQDFREHGLASGLLNELRNDEDDLYGLMSSHPAAILAAAKVFGNSIDNLPLHFIRDHARAVMSASPIAYVKDAQLRGSLFATKDNKELISGVDTNFFVDHEEPLEALSWVREKTKWPLGDLPDGHEFIAVIQAKRRSPGMSRLASRDETNV